jgi:hypothetical protein
MATLRDAHGYDRKHGDSGRPRRGEQLAGCDNVHGIDTMFVTGWRGFYFESSSLRVCLIQ